MALPVEPHLTFTLTYKKSVIGWVGSIGRRLRPSASTTEPASSRRAGCNKWNDGFCFDAWWSGTGTDKKLDIRVELPSNGRGKGI